MMKLQVQVAAFLGGLAPLLFFAPSGASAVQHLSVLSPETDFESAHKEQVEIATRYMKNEKFAQVVSRHVFYKLATTPTTKKIASSSVCCAAFLAAAQKPSRDSSVFPRPRAVFMAGPMGSGKSTFRRAIAAKIFEGEPFQVINSDDMIWAIIETLHDLNALNEEYGGALNDVLSSGVYDNRLTLIKFQDVHGIAYKGAMTPVKTALAQHAVDNKMHLLHDGTQLVGETKLDDGNGMQMHYRRGNTPFDQVLSAGYEKIAFIIEPPSENECYRRIWNREQVYAAEGKAWKGLELILGATTKDGERVEPGHLIEGTAEENEHIKYELSPKLEKTLKRAFDGAMEAASLNVGLFRQNSGELMFPGKKEPLAREDHQYDRIYVGWQKTVFDANNVEEMPMVELEGQMGSTS